MHCVLVAAIIVKAQKSREKNLLAQFSTKLNQSFIKLWEYLDTKRNIIYTKKNVLLKNEKNAMFFPERVATNFRKQKLDI